MNKTLLITVIAIVVLVLSFLIVNSYKSASSRVGMGWTKIDLSLKDIFHYFYVAHIKPPAPDTLVISLPKGWSIKVDNRIWDDAKGQWKDPIYELTSSDGSFHISPFRAEITSVSNDRITAWLSERRGSDTAVESPCRIDDFSGICGYTNASDSPNPTPEYEYIYDDWLGFFHARKDASLGVIAKYPHGKRSKFLEELKDILRGILVLPYAQHNLE